MQRPILDSGKSLFKNLKRMTDISLKTQTIETRFAAWQSAWNGWQERFILGWGPENFNVLFSKYFDPMHYKGFGSEVVWDRAHNTPLNIGATMGLVGLLSYLSIFIVLLWCLVGLLKHYKRDTNDANKHSNDMNTQKKIGIGVLGAMFIAYIGHNMFIFDTFNSYLMFFIVIGYISYLRRDTQINPRHKVGDTQIHAEKFSVDQRMREKRARYQRISAIILIPIVFFTIWKTAIIPVKANYAATRGITFGRSVEHFSIAFDYFRKSLSYNAIQTEYEVRHRLARFVFNVFSKGDDVQKFGVEKEDITFALDEIYKNIKTDPLDPIPHLYAARLNEFLSRIIDPKEAEEKLKEAERLLEKTIILNKKNPYIYFELGQVRIFQNRLKEAIKFFEQGISIKPDVELGYWYKGITYLDMKEIEKGEESINQAIERGYSKSVNIERGYSKSVNDIHRLLKIYVPIKNYPKIIELYLEAIKLQPNNAQFYASLATAYQKNGQIDKAIETARMVGELDPTKKSEAEAWINMLKSM